MWALSQDANSTVEGPQWWKTAQIVAARQQSVKAGANTFQVTLPVLPFLARTHLQIACAAMDSSVDKSADGYSTVMAQSPSKSPTSEHRLLGTIWDPNHNSIIPSLDAYTLVKLWVNCRLLSTTYKKAKCCHVFCTTLVFLCIYILYPRRIFKFLKSRKYSLSLSHIYIYSGPRPCQAAALHWAISPAPILCS